MPGAASDLRRPPRRRAWPMVVTAAVLLVLGAVVATQVGGALGLSNTPADIPTEVLRAAAQRRAVPPPQYRAIVVPDEPQTELAARTLARDLAARGARRPVVRHTVEAAGPAVRARVDPRLSPSPQAYRLRAAGGDLEVAGASVTGVANGLYAVADRIRSQDRVIPDAQDGAVVVPAMELRLTDLGSVGIEADAEAFRAGTDYGLSTAAIGSALLAEAPYVDEAAVARIARQYRQLIDHSLAIGYNGVVVPGFLEYLTFDGVGNGDEVYARDDPRRVRAEALAKAFAPVWRYAHDMGMKVFFSTDMLALSPPLRQYLVGRFGGLAVTDPAFWGVYQAGLREFFRRMPYAAGLMVRIGEGGDIYRMPGWDFTSEIAVTTPAAVQAMLTALLDAAGAQGKDVIFRSWTVGVGAVGRLHTSQDAYREVLGGIDADNLIVSTKFTKGDFYSHLPFNDTLLAGDHRRIVEFQARREFEGFGSLPNDLGSLHQAALNQFLDRNPNIVGVWNWTQDGGPLRAGPMTLYLRAGFWQLYGLNTYALARLAWDPKEDPAQITADWARQTLSRDPATVAAISRAMALSREAVTKGLYIGPYADQTVKALGLEPPPMMWIFEWDIPTGDSAALDSIYAVSRDRIDDAIAEGEQATRTAEQMRALIAGTDPATWRDRAAFEQFLATLDYQVNLFETLGAYRAMVLRHAQWLDTGAPAAQQAWADARARFLAARDQHVSRYAGDTALPAYNSTAADLGLARAERDPAMAWLARGLFVLLVVFVGLGSRPAQRRLRGRPGAAAARVLWIGLTRPWRLGDLDVAPTRLDRVLVWLVPALAVVASRGILTWFLSPAHLIVVLGAWTLFALTVLWFTRGRGAFWVGAGIGGAALLRTFILLVALMSRGPGRYWFNFWTAPTMRTVYLTLAFAAFVWVFVVAALVLRDRYGLRMRGAIGRVLVAVGVPLIVLGGLVQLLGLEPALSAWNDQMALLPWGLSRILGITVYLGIPDSLPLVAIAAGGVLLLAGALLSWRTRSAAASDELPTRGAPPRGEVETPA